MDDPNVYQEIGQLQAKVEMLESGLNSMRAEVKTDAQAMNAKLDTLLLRSAEAKGARGMLWKVGGASSALTGALFAFLEWYTGTFGRGP